jgi:hypothetical protein
MMERCPFCGTAAAPPARFCIICGRALADVDPQVARALDVEALDRLRREKRRLSLEMHGLEKTAGRNQSWEAVRSAWQDITTELTAKLDAIAPRTGTDRRTKERRMGQERRDQDQPFEGAERRSGLQRRRGERRTGQDRRASPERDGS